MAQTNQRIKTRAMDALRGIIHLAQILVADVETHGILMVLCDQINQKSETPVAQKLVIQVDNGGIVSDAPLPPASGLFQSGVHIVIRKIRDTYERLLILTIIQAANLQSTLAEARVADASADRASLYADIWLQYWQNPTLHIFDSCTQKSVLYGLQLLAALFDKERGAAIPHQSDREIIRAIRDVDNIGRGTAKREALLPGKNTSGGEKLWENFESGHLSAADTVGDLVDTLTLHLSQHPA